MSIKVTVTGNQTAGYAWSDGSSTSYGFASPYEAMADYMTRYGNVEASKPASPAWANARESADVQYGRDLLNAVDELVSLGATRNRAVAIVATRAAVSGITGEDIRRCTEAYQASQH